MNGATLYVTRPFLISPYRRKAFEKQIATRMRYGGLRIRAGEHRRSISIWPISRAKSSKMREDLSGEDQRCSVRPQTANAPNGGPRKRGRIGRHAARSIGEVHTRSP